MIKSTVYVTSDLLQIDIQRFNLYSRCRADIFSFLSCVYIATEDRTLRGLWVVHDFRKVKLRVICVANWRLKSPDTVFKKRYIYKCRHLSAALLGKAGTVEE